MTEPENPFELTDDEVIQLTMAYLHGNDGSASEEELESMLREAQSWKIDKCFFDAAVQGVAYLKHCDNGDLALVANPAWPDVPDYTKPKPVTADASC